MVSLSLVEQAHSESALLEKIRVGCSVFLGGSALHDMKLTRRRDERTNAIVYQLKTFILAEKVRELDETVVFEYPKDWWEHFKFQYFPAWLKTYFPVRLQSVEKTCHFEQHQCFPKINRALPPDELQYEFTNLRAVVTGPSPFATEEP